VGDTCQGQPARYWVVVVGARPSCKKSTKSGPTNRNGGRSRANQRSFKTGLPAKTRDERCQPTNLNHHRNQSKKPNDAQAPTTQLRAWPRAVAHVCGPRFPGNHKGDAGGQGSPVPDRTMPAVPIAIARCRLLSLYAR